MASGFWEWVEVIENEEGIKIEYGFKIFSGEYACVLWAYGDFTSITIPSKVQSRGRTFEVRVIDDEVFKGRKSLTSISLPSTIERIRFGAFSGCKNLTSVNITDLAAWCNISFASADSRSGNIDYNKNTTDPRYDLSTGISNPLFYARHLFLNGTEIKDLVIPDGITSIRDAAFVGFTGLTSVTIPNSVTVIGASAFNYCVNLTTVNLPESLKEIGNYAFHKCKSLVTIMIPYVEHIESGAFSGCSGLTSITLGYGKIKKRKLKMEYSAFDSNMDAFITLGENWADIDFGKLSGCKIIVKNFDERCIEKRFFGIGSNYLYSEQKTEVKDLVIPEGTTFVKDFTNIQNSFNSIIIPSTVEDIKKEAFWGCKTKVIVVLATDPPYLDYKYSEIDRNIKYSYDFAFRDLYKETVLYIPKGCKHRYERDEYLDRYYEEQMVANRTVLINKYLHSQDSWMLILWRYYKGPNYGSRVFTYGAWWDFKHIEEGIPTDISQPQLGKDKTKTIYQIDGTRTSQLHKGINIIKNSDGTTKKVLIK
jgi:hypothetical protein